MKQHYYTMPDAMIRAFFGKKTITFAIDIVIRYRHLLFYLKYIKTRYAYTEEYN